MLSAEEVEEAIAHDIIQLLSVAIGNVEVLELNEDQKSFQLAIAGRLVTVSVKAE